MLTVQLSAVQVLALAAGGLGLGAAVKRALPVLERLNLPTAIVGGLLLAVVQLALRDRVVNFELELWLRDLTSRRSPAPLMRFSLLVEAVLLVEALAPVTLRSRGPDHHPEITRRDQAPLECPG